MCLHGFSVWLFQTARSFQQDVSDGCVAEEHARAWHQIGILCGGHLQSWLLRPLHVRKCLWIKWRSWSDSKWLKSFLSEFHVELPGLGLSRQLDSETGRCDFDILLEGDLEEISLEKFCKPWTSVSYRTVERKSSHGKLLLQHGMEQRWLVVANNLCLLQRD